MRKGDTDIEIGGFEPQTGDFENKSQNTYKMIFWRSYMSALWRKIKKFPDIYEVILSKFNQNLTKSMFLKRKLVFVPVNALPRRQAQEYFGF